MGTSEFIALIAVAIAFVSLYRTRKQNEIVNRFNEISSKLAEIQLSNLEREELERNSAILNAYFYKDYNDSYRIAITNHGEATAHDVMFTIDMPEDSRSPLIESDVKSKLPAKELHSGNEIYLLASICLGMPSAFDGVLSWKNPDGKEISKTVRLTLGG